jgi:polyhydroxyalkanoate synthase subunit PhaC
MKDTVALSPEEHARQTATEFDSRLRAAGAKLTLGLSPIALTLAYVDWSAHLMSQPAQAVRLATAWMQGGMEALSDTLYGRQDDAPDPRFAHPGWKHWPWAPIVHSYHAAERWWDDATQLRGMGAHHKEMTRFYARQWLDMMSPTNSGLWGNPEVKQRTRERLGGNLVDGAITLMDNWRQEHGLSPLRQEGPAYRPGHEVAITPGRVVHRNHLTELLQFDPTTPTVQREPVFIVPSWIMKYYILDLSPHNSFVKWLTDQGHTVFILSWHNPDEADALLDMSDYLHEGVFDNLAAIASLIPDTPVHACGYCLGGTLLSIGASALARPGKIHNAEALPTLKTLTLLAAETDFSEPGEMGVLIDESQVTLLEDMMAERGFLTGGQMGGSFSFLHSRELVWSEALRELWMGESSHPNDLMAWNADTTRMPAVMHSEYLRRCYLRNEIAEGRFPVEGRAVALSDLHVPLFVVGTEKDHVSPWKSVYKIHRLADTEVTFVLTSGGHNAGIVSEPGHPHRHYALLTRAADGPWLEPDLWKNEAATFEGSWWTAWHAWLSQHSEGEVPARIPPVIEHLPAAPGHYVHQCHRD